MPRLVTAIAAIAFLICGLARAEASIVITVDKTTQRLSVAVNGTQRYEWPVSTARRGYLTPNGTYRPQRLERKWFSRKYDWSPMPYSIFFHEGYAIHGSYEISHLGSPASHGCIRLLPAHAAILFALVKKDEGDTRIVVTGERPSGRVIAERASTPRSTEGSARARAPQPAYQNNFYQPNGFSPSPGYQTYQWSPPDAAANDALARKHWQNR
jgi:L,D-transpeptidase catalytic domain